MKRLLVLILASTCLIHGGIASASAVVRGEPTAPIPGTLGGGGNR